MALLLRCLPPVGQGGLGTPAQVLAWTVVIGAAQRLVTGHVDRKAGDVLGQVPVQKNKVIQ